MRRLLLPIAIATLVAACSDTRDAHDGAVAPGLDAGPRDGGGPPPGTDGAVPPGTDASVPPGGDGGGPPGTDAGPPGPSVAFCTLGCSVEADCTTASPAYDADNYVCDGDTCLYTGCVDDAECQSTFASTDYVCRDPGTGLRTCLEGCGVASDCGSPSPAFDADNYACEGGTCRYQGCNDDAECMGTFGASYGCVDADPPPTPLPLPVARRNCVRRCSTADDCATDGAAFSADNYTCEGGACRYRGCNDAAECRASLSSASYVCR